MTQTTNEDASEEQREQTVRPFADGGTLSLDDVFRILSNRRRRLALYLLFDASGSVDRDELASQLVAWERGVDVDDVPRDAVTTLNVELEHVHLPRLREANVVSYGRDERTLTLTETATRLKPYLDVSRDEDFEALD
ncbi:DUF7344 domain-containing protein [Halogeometricum limi]|uniref:DUF7344 domain-containing protein n=1 Tax=Halogeometricum limi TaxID=555875 RepID=A0A1I6HEL4_9EURY|nr:hypothetical protein [Halogeometricum limi]SFR52727.1 hypothetical protein SAMN04488124_2125 [Halogeometricum limi]